MRPLAGHRVAVLGGMADRPLARFLASLGAEIGGAVEGASFVIDDLGLRTDCAILAIPDRRHPCLGHALRLGRAARALAWRRTGGLGHGRRVAGDRRARPAAGQGSGRCLHLPRRHGGRRGRDGGAFCARHPWHRASMSTCRSSRSLSAATSTACWCGSSTGASSAAPAARIAYGKVEGAGDLAAGRWLVLPCADDRAARRAGQPGAVGLDGRGRHGQSAARHRLAGLQPLDPAGRNARDLGGGHRRLLRARAPRPKSPAKAGGAGSMPAWSTSRPMCWPTSISPRANSSPRRRACRSASPRFAKVSASGGAGDPCRQAARARFRASRCSISPGRWSDRSPPRRWAISARKWSRSKAARGPTCRGSTCRSRPRSPATSTTSRGSPISTRSKRSLTLNLKDPALARSARSADRLGRRGGRELLARHHGQARPRL